MSGPGFAAAALTELDAVMARMDWPEVDAACAGIAAAGSVMVCGCGREGLMMQGFAMRLHHLGLRASVQGDMAAPPLGKGDLLIASAGPGELSTVTALMHKARDAGAGVLFLTAVPGTPSARLADRVLKIPAQTMATDRAGASALPMGSLYEGALFVVFEAMVDRLAGMLGQTAETMRARHTNME